MLSYLIAIKVAQTNNESLEGKVFDRVKGMFVPVSEVRDPNLQKQAFNESFFLKNGSYLTRLEAEVRALDQQLMQKKKQGYKNPHYASTMICRDSKNKTSSGFIQPG
jgi:hypothetical protein